MAEVERVIVTAEAERAIVTGSKIPTAGEIGSNPPRTVLVCPADQEVLSERKRPGAGTLVGDDFLRREGGDDFFEARLAA